MFESEHQGCPSQSIKDVRVRASRMSESEHQGCPSQSIKDVRVRASRMFESEHQGCPSQSIKDVRVRASRMFVRKVGRDPSYLSRIITADETWVHYFELESKQASMHPDRPPPKKAKAVKLMGKDNAPSHTAMNTQLDIDVLGFQRAIHPPYSPILRHWISHIFQS
ncbi:LOW QUALITY PROTEIN: hypothetical protein MAR_035000 [Mya arenaria]|uniref:Transposase n=1 Tax=Mya arenaria TaxID=6604 RepID=A0ABY7ELP0_MYAAR|nr:LOW QUALITY PROTEIN: hypothetical protein MAR_035000 [Mya arenaria]